MPTKYSLDDASISFAGMECVGLIDVCVDDPMPCRSGSPAVLEFDFVIDADCIWYVGVERLEFASGD